MKFSAVLIGILLSGSSFGQSTIVGTWKTIDDNSGKARSVVEIFERDGKFYGEVMKIFPEPGEDPDPVCSECEGEKNGQKVVGMEIISDMKFDRKKNEYDKGEILDPENGNVYDCKLWVEDGNLKVRGYLLFFYRTQTWLPYSE